MENPSQAKTVQAGMIGAPALKDISADEPLTKQLNEAS
jgi:hypothetical protein